MTELELYWIEAVSVISDEGGLTGLEPFPLNMSKDIARGDHGTIVENFNDGADKVNPLQNYAGIETFIGRFFFWHGIVVFDGYYKSNLMSVHSTVFEWGKNDGKEVRVIAHHLYMIPFHMEYTYGRRSDWLKQ